jgi:polysaccharide export outer membrane protein
MISATCLVLTAWYALVSGQAQDTAKQTTPEKSATTEPGNAKTAVTHQPSMSDNSYKIGPQDVLRIDVWKEPEISRSVPVRPDGKISLPLLNDVQAAGLTATQLADIITDGLKKFINNPQVTVGVSEINSRRVYVTGEVTRPGAFPLLPNMTVLQALTSAGGFTQFARIKSIYVLRTADGKQAKHSFNYKDVVNGKKPEDNIELQPGDTIVVP